MNKRESAVDIVINSIKQLLIDRRLKPGEKLPSESEISEGLGVSRGSVREAMKILSAFGLIEIKVGNGTYVCESPGNDVMDSFLFNFFATAPNIENLYELRIIIEIDILELIIQHYDTNYYYRKKILENLEELKSLIEQIPTDQQLLKNDLEFHHLLAKASDNLLVERVYNFIIDLMESSLAPTYQNQHGKSAYMLHKNIVDVIENRDIARIEEVIKASVNTWSYFQPLEQ